MEQIIDGGVTMGQGVKVELGIDLREAKQIDRTIPQWTLMKADRVIR